MGPPCTDFLDVLEVQLGICTALLSPSLLDRGVSLFGPRTLGAHSHDRELVWVGKTLDLHPKGGFETGVNWLRSVMEL
jgi:hypothetical protein